MASQAIIIHDTIAAMKKALKRKADDSEEDDPIEQLTNRGNKLRKYARYTREGQVALPNGPEIYKKTVEHAGHRREIISERPRPLDEDGVELDSDDEDDEDRLAAGAAATELYPYENVRIEKILAPLASAADLPNHPTLSRPFESKILSGLTQQACEMVHKEKASLWKMKSLLRRLCGDDPWIPCEVLETDDDLGLFGDIPERIRGENLGTSRSRVDPHLSRENALRSDHEGFPQVENEINNQVPHGKGISSAEDVAMTDAVPVFGTEVANSQTMAASETADGDNGISFEKCTVASKLHDRENEAGLGTGDIDMTTEADQRNGNHASEENRVVGETDAEEAEEETEPAVPRRMRTRAQAHAASDDTPTSRTRSATPDYNSDAYVHPYFLAPRASHPDRDFSLPKAEAADARRLLQLYIQKQEEVCRGAQKLYDGLLRADRMRKNVMKWAKAEAHIGEMSDGEDWYDRDEWNLDEDLVKGHDDEEEETTTTNKKTTRARRV